MGKRPILLQNDAKVLGELNFFFFEFVLLYWSYRVSTEGSNRILNSCSI